ncbi:MAG: kinase/pyrophosphorylase, partial [Rhodospirillales bacterium]|nr:kinase/pyrophosphorylase [Rhodospirillales bacterium]
VKAANIPLVPHMPPPCQLIESKRPLVVGLTRDPKSLCDIRKNRLRFLNEDPETTYTDFDRVRQEVSNARRLFARHSWPVIDVTRRSIEEAAATILQHLTRRQSKGANVI